MRGATEFLSGIRSIVKLHESMLKDICEAYRLTLTEATVISFLHNNPQKDTAADIVELRMLQKSNVSCAVETLFQKHLLSRRQDEADRRKVHLSLTDEAAHIIESLDILQAEFRKEVFCGFSEEDMKVFDSMNERISSNTKRAMERRGQK